MVNVGSDETEQSETTRERKLAKQQPTDIRSSEAKGYHWASKIMTVSLEMVVPGVAGYFLLDRYLGTKFVFCLLGFAGGMTLGIWHLVKFSEQLNAQEKDSKRQEPNNEK